jgi:hypothetical protein
MTDDEKEYMKLIVQTSMSVAIKPLTDELADHSLSIQRVTQTVYGATGTNGLNGSMKTIKKDVEELQTAKIKIMAWTSAASGIIVLGGSLFGEKIKRMLGI